ncbi:aminotransferase class V-fold PLP-dependent enzyme [Pseudoalteromonas sp. CO348]|uniref:aminotransferase class V-fold PLP-dependent enzyme n=1 Tax=unclassified Pseudoalteromonas TaxID=194690 RepID=UPI001022F531|nr:MULTISPECIES: aminotransferase class V-fold PLP-dependent enzyme [unclassified Pseudoalteromonas]MCG7540018.1 aminotransferase class V-fold PLP-dependent enzyme [Pseudoalteromonas sp. OF7H-1]RZG07249.1 aminotransferase class V-fold PLP-dependent enzyme [Pseudoalteromonas sp. CO348]
MKDFFYGTNFKFTNANGESVTRVYLDSAASTLALKPAQAAVNEFLKYYSNTHSTVHLSAQISTEIVSWSSNVLKSFFGCNEDYSVVYLGGGATSPINRLARGLASLDMEKQKVLISMMEHHSNDLPHRVNSKEVLTIPVFDKTGEFVGVEIDTVREIFEKNNGQIKYVAITAASNVSGHLNEIYDIAEIAHEHGAYIIVDGAQVAAHMPIVMSQVNPKRSIDFFVFSGHKAYAPGSPGVLLGRNDLLRRMKPEFYGGGMVSTVSKSDYIVSEDDFDKEHAGTLNISGIFKLANVFKFLDKIGINNIYEKEIYLTNYMIKSLRSIPGVNIYADKDTSMRISAISFNLKNVPHQLLSLILNDYFGIAVRNECFCAHPYVRECLLDELWEIDNEDEVELYQGMVRASLGLYSTIEDIDALCEAIREIIDNRVYFTGKYKLMGSSFKHLNYDVELKNYFDPDAVFEKLSCIREVSIDA